MRGCVEGKLVVEGVMLACVVGGSLVGGQVLWRWLEEVL